MAQRERDDIDARWRHKEQLDAERRRDEQYRQQEQERDRERQQALSRGPPPIQPGPFGGSSFSQNRTLDLRSQSRMETEQALREEHERQRMQQDADSRRPESALRDRDHAEEFRRRQEEMYRRTTPLGGTGFGIPPPPSQRRQ